MGNGNGHGYWAWGGGGGATSFYKKGKTNKNTHGACMQFRHFGIVWLSAFFSFPHFFFSDFFAQKRANGIAWHGIACIFFFVFCIFERFLCKTRYPRLGKNTHATHALYDR